MILGIELKMESLVDDELEEGEIRETQERNIADFPKTLPHLDDFEEGEVREEKVEEGDIREEKIEEGDIREEKKEEEEMREEKIEEELIASVQNSPAYSDDLEEGEIRDETDPSSVVVLYDQEPMVSPDVTTIMELSQSKEPIAREKVCLKFRGKEHLEVHAKKKPTFQFFHRERLSSKTNHLKGHTNYPDENSLTRQVEEICSKRFNELLSLQYLECKRFKLLKNELKMEFEVNCSGKLSAQDSEILDDKFEKHMKAQYRILIAMLIGARNKEVKLKEQWLEKVREGTFEVSFCETPLPSSGFKMEKFNYEVETGDLLAGKSLNDDMHLDVVDDEGSLGSETLLKGRVESDHEIDEVSHCNDNKLTATSVDPKGILKSPSISIPSCNFESEEMSEERNKIGCNETILAVPESCAENLNLSPNCPEMIMPNSNFESGAGTLEEHELACIGTVSIGLAGTVQNPISNTNSTPGIVHSDPINTADSDSLASIRSQECQVNSAMNLSCSSGIATATNLRVSIEENTIVETPMVNQNEAFAQQSAIRTPAPDTDVGTQNLDVLSETPLINQNEAYTEQSSTRMPAPDTVLVTQLLQMMRHDVNVDPLQNELSALRKLQKALIEKHNEKMARLRKEYEEELANTRRKFQRLEAEADAQWSDHRTHIDTAYQKLCMHRKLAEEFQQMFYRPNFIGQLPIQANRAGFVGREQFTSSSQPRFTPNSILRPAVSFASQPQSTSNYGFVPNPYTIPQVVQPSGFIPSGQIPSLSIQGPQNFLNQPTRMHSSLASAPIRGPVLLGVYPGIPQLNHMRPSSLSMPSVRLAMADFRNIQI